MTGRTMNGRKLTATGDLTSGIDGDVPAWLRVLAVLGYVVGTLGALVAVCMVLVCLVPVFLGGLAGWCAYRAIVRMGWLR